MLFSDNRIQRGMLLDLTKDYLTDMGVNRLGDIIAILKHAKTVHSQDAKDKALKGVRITGDSSSPFRRATVPVFEGKMVREKLTISNTEAKLRHTASRMVDHFLAKDPEAAPMNQPTPPPKPVNAGKKSSVFDRLGSDSPILGSSPKPNAIAESVFNRLGGKTGQKRSASPEETDQECAHSPLEYQGILKSPVLKPLPAPSRKKIRVTVEEPAKVSTGLEKFRVTGFDKVKVTGLDRMKVQSQKVFDIEDMQSIKVQVSSTTTSAKSKRRTTMPATSSADDVRPSKPSSIQKNEVTTTTLRTAGILSMDAPTAGPVKTRLGAKVQYAPASSTTAGFGPSTKTAAVSDVKSRLGAKPAVSTQPSSKSLLRPKLTITTSTSSTQPKAKASSGVFSRLGKKAAS